MSAVDVFPDGSEDVGYALEHEPTAGERAALVDAAARAAGRGVTATTSLLAGPATQAIVDEAESRRVDLNIVGSRGHGVIAGVFLGSVSVGVLRKATRPVLIVKPGDSRQPARSESAGTTSDDLSPQVV
jgi:nucleotide-binding universal stress UspA family protein